MMDRKLALLAIIALILLGASYWFYFEYFKKAPVEEQKITAIAHRKAVDDAVISPTHIFSDDAIWYGNTAGRLFRLKIEDDTVSEFPLPNSLTNFKSIAWSDEGNYIAFSEDQFGKTIAYYNANEKSYTKLPNNISVLDFLPDGRVAMIWRSGDGKSQQLVVSNADASGYRIVTSLPWPDFQIDVSPTGDQALLVRGDPKPQKIYLFNLTDGGWETLIESPRISGAKWIDPKRFIYDAVGPNSKPTIYIYDKETKTTRELGIETSIDLVDWDPLNRVFYAAVDAGKDKQKLVKIAEGQTPQDYYTGMEDVWASKVLYSNGAVYFVNAKDNKLYSIK